jgi:hypothetical protein
MEYSIVRVDKDNYLLFDETVFYRKNEIYPTKAQSPQSYFLCGLCAFAGYIKRRFYEKIKDRNKRQIPQNLYLCPDFRTIKQSNNET